MTAQSHPLSAWPRYEAHRWSFHLIRGAVEALRHRKEASAVHRWHKAAAQLRRIDRLSDRAGARVAERRRRHAWLAWAEYARALEGKSTKRASVHTTSSRSSERSSPNASRSKPAHCVSGRQSASTADKGTLDQDLDWLLEQLGRLVDRCCKARQPARVIVKRIRTHRDVMHHDQLIVIKQEQAVRV